jgi:hypothetical protein
MKRTLETVHDFKETDVLFSKKSNNKKIELDYDEMRTELKNLRLEISALKKEVYF